MEEWQMNWTDGIAVRGCRLLGMQGCRIPVRLVVCFEDGDGDSSGGPDGDWQWRARNSFICTQ